jgi:lysozyme family protein
MTESKRNFLAALAATLKHEGVYNADRLDPGGETFMGISRRYWPTWAGWRKIDEWLLADRPEMDLTTDVREFYYTQFWCRFQGDKVAAISPPVACELFDTAVNLGLSDAVRFFQTAMNMQNRYQQLYPDLRVDGQLGQKTINTLERYLGNGGPTKRAENENILLNCMNGEQYVAYKSNPQHEYFRGWFGRV